MCVYYIYIYIICIWSYSLLYTIYPAKLWYFSNLKTGSLLVGRAATEALTTWLLESSGGCTRICQIRYQNSLTTASFFLGDLKLSCSPTWHLEFRCNLTWAFACLWGTDLAINIKWISKKEKWNKRKKIPAKNHASVKHLATEKQSLSLYLGVSPLFHLLVKPAGSSVYGLQLAAVSHCRHSPEFWTWWFANAATLCKLTTLWSVASVVDDLWIW